MAVKGERARLEPLAIKLYADGHTLSAIAAQLNISDTSLRKWKEESKSPVSDIDEWDRARNQKRGNTQRVKDLFERQLLYVEGLQAHEVSPGMMDTLSKLGALVERSDKIEKAAAVAEEVVKEVKKSGLSDDKVNEIRRKILGIGE